MNYINGVVHTKAKHNRSQVKSKESFHISVFQLQSFRKKKDRKEVDDRTFTK